MIASTITAHLWLRVYIVLAICACYARCNPIFQQLASKSEKESQYCGEELAIALRNTCSLFRGMFDDMEPGEGSGKGHSAADECCKKPCTNATLRGFCRKVRYQPPGTDPITTEVGNKKNPIYFINKETTIESLEATESMQTDPTSRPEVAYAGELWDQEPLTLLPTYTSPDYTLNVMQQL